MGLFVVLSVIGGFLFGLVMWCCFDFDVRDVGVCGGGVR